MLNLKPSDENSGLQKTIDNLLSQMEEVRPESEEYAAMATQLNVIYKLKEVDSKRKVSPDTLVVAATNLIGIILIIRHERLNVIASKAISFVHRLS